MMNKEDRKCSNCGRSDEVVKLIRYYTKGNEDYVCMQCLPMFIHG
ncbi:MAG: hypothetical protein ACE5G7_07085 [Candidatus Hydrothermarchaeaceae archaeon]